MMGIVKMNSLASYTFLTRCETVSADKQREHSLQAVVFITLFASIYCICNLIGKPAVAPYAVLALNVLYYATGFVPKTVFFSSFLLGNEMCSLINLLVGLYVLRKRAAATASSAKLHLSPSNWALVFLLLTMSVVNALQLGTLINTFVSVAYYFFLCFVFYQLRGLFRKTDLRNCVTLFAWGEFAIVMSTCLLHGFHPGDANCGSLGNAHFLGLWCCLSLLILWTTGEPLRRVKLNQALVFRVLPYCPLLLCFFFSDTKAPVLCGVLALIVTLAIYSVFKTKTAAPAFVAFLSIFLAAIVCFSSPSVEKALMNIDGKASDIITLYMYNDKTALKFKYFQDTSKHLLEEGKLVTGYGLGQYGSRFSNLFGYSYAYREDSVINRLVPMFVDSRMLDDYKTHAGKYDEELVSQIGNYSAISVYPFSSLMALIAEGGIVLLLLIWSLLRSYSLNMNSQLVLMFFVGCCAMDLYFDHIQLIGLVILALATLGTVKERRQLASLK